MNKHYEEVDIKMITDNFDIVLSEENLSIVQNIVEAVSQSVIDTLAEFNDLNSLGDAHYLLIGYNITTTVNELCNKIIKTFSEESYFCFYINGIIEENILSSNFVILNKNKLSQHIDADSDLMKYIKVVRIILKQ
jgi:hypothetical protein